MVRTFEAESYPAHEVPGVAVMMQASAASVVRLSCLERNPHEARHAATRAGTKDDRCDGDVRAHDIVERRWRQARGPRRGGADSG